MSPMSIAGSRPDGDRDLTHDLANPIGSCRGSLTPLRCSTKMESRSVSSTRRSRWVFPGFQYSYPHTHSDLDDESQGNHVTSEGQAGQIVSQIRFSGLTPLGTALDQKILQPMLLNPARQGQLRKPLLIIVISDGAP